MLQRRLFLGKWPELNNSHFHSVKELISSSSNPPAMIIQTIFEGDYELPIKLAAIVELLEHPTEQDIIERPGELTNKLDRDCIGFLGFPPQLIEYIAEGVLIAKNGTPISREKLVLVPTIMRDFYNRCILQLLPLLPPKKLRDKLFRALSLRDYLPFVAHGAKSGYEPFVQLLLHPHIPMAYKKDADTRMRVIIRKECGVFVGMRKNKNTPYKAKITLPREQHEHAIHWYVELLRRSMNDTLPLYPRHFLRDQVAFVHSLERIVPENKEREIRTLMQSFLNLLDSHTAAKEKAPA